MRERKVNVNLLAIPRTYLARLKQKQGIENKTRAKETKKA